MCVSKHKFPFQNTNLFFQLFNYKKTYFLFKNTNLLFCFVMNNVIIQTHMLMKQKYPIQHTNLCFIDTLSHSHHHYHIRSHIYDLHHTTPSTTRRLPQPSRADCVRLCPQNVIVGVYGHQQQCCLVMSMMRSMGTDQGQSQST